MLNFLNPRYRHIRARHNLPYDQAGVQGEVTVTSVVIPCTGADYIEEALLSATFAARFATQIEEIVIVSDQPAAALVNCRLKPGLRRWTFRIARKTIAISRSIAAG